MKGWGRKESVDGMKMGKWEYPDENPKNFQPCRPQIPLGFELKTKVMVK